MQNKHTMFIVIAILVIVGVGYGIFRMRSESPEIAIPQGKLNISEVCGGALAYMTFPDGKSADTFVAECIEGKYPEVIEKYKADMGLRDGASI